MDQFRSTASTMDSCNHLVYSANSLSVANAFLGSASPQQLLLHKKLIAYFSGVR